MLKRLSVQIYATIIASLVLVVILGSTATRILPDGGGPGQALRIVGELILPDLPPAGSDPADQRAALEKLHRVHKLDLALYDIDRQIVASAGDSLPVLRPRHRTGSRLRGSGFPAWVVGLPDGRWVVIRTAIEGWHPALNLIAFLGAVAFAVALGAYPIVRRLTRRLERLQIGVELLGGGDLSARVEVEGRDEVSRLAASFNRSAERIENLVAAHRLLLANVSHELRTPLSRIRVGIEFLKQQPDSRRQEALESDIAELDRLIGQVLLSSRLDALNDEIAREEVDLLALAAEEAARYRNCNVAGSIATVSGDPMLLRQLIRNLIENAERYGVPPIDVRVTGSNEVVHLTITDQGDGVPANERDRVFEPFYKIAGVQSGVGTGLGLALVRQIARRHGGEAGWCIGDDRPSCIGVELPAFAAAPHEGGANQSD